jgi:hypothetical protein
MVKKLATLPPKTKKTKKASQGRMGSSIALSQSWARATKLHKETGIAKVSTARSYLALQDNGRQKLLDTPKPLDKRNPKVKGLIEDYKTFAKTAPSYKARASKGDPKKTPRAGVQDRPKPVKVQLDPQMAHANLIVEIRNLCTVYGVNCSDIIHVTTVLAKLRDEPIAVDNCALAAESLLTECNNGK